MRTGSWFSFFLLLTFTVLFGCARAPVKEPSQAMRLSKISQEAWPEDRESIESLQSAFASVLKVFKENKNLNQSMIFGDRLIGREDYERALRAAIEAGVTPLDFKKFVSDNFEVYEVYGNSEGWGQVFTTGYFAPVYSGRIRRQAKFTQPIFKTPADFVTVDLSAFVLKRPDLEWLQKLNKEQNGRPLMLRGRISREPDGTKILPYYTRSEIDGAKDWNTLLGKNLELAWLDPIDAIYLQIQGSGAIEFPGGKRLYVGYDKQNGYPWFPIGRALTDIIPIEQMTMQRVRAHLKTLSPEELRFILDRDPSYVFFRKLEGLPVGSFGAEVVGQRSIATDNFLFPKGALAFLDIEIPKFDSPDQVEPTSWERKPRFVFDIDTGGAIKGGGRVDLYMGEGSVMGQLAGVMKQHGKLWYLAPKQEFIEKLKTKSQR